MKVPNYLILTNIEAMQQIVSLTHFYNRAANAPSPSPSNLLLWHSPTLDHKQAQTTPTLNFGIRY